MEDIFFMVTGCNHYFGTEALSEGNLVQGT